MNAAYLPVLWHTIATVVCGALLLLIYRDVRARSAPVAALLACGLLLRAAAGLVLFWVSYLDAGWLSHLHQGDGFWVLALDARAYHETAAQAVEAGITSISSTEASPAYTRGLALWMHLVGVSPASGFFLNLVLFASLGGLLARTFGVNGDWRHDLPCLLTLGAFTCSPVLLIHGTQPLKDDFFTFLIVGSILAAVAVAARLAQGTLPAHQIRAFVGSLLLLLLALYLMAGVRAYFAFLFCGSLSVALAVQAFRQRSDGLLRYLAASGLGPAGARGTVAVVPGRRVRARLRFRR